MSSSSGPPAHQGSHEDPSHIPESHRRKRPPSQIDLPAPSRTRSFTAPGTPLSPCMSAPANYNYAVAQSGFMPALRERRQSLATPLMMTAPISIPPSPRSAAANADTPWWVPPSPVASSPKPGPPRLQIPPVSPPRSGEMLPPESPRSASGTMFSWWPKPQQNSATAMPSPATTATSEAPSLGMTPATESSERCAMSGIPDEQGRRGSVLFQSEMTQTTMQQSMEKETEEVVGVVMLALGDI